MAQECEDIAVACYVGSRVFGAREQTLLKVIVVGELVHEQDPFETDQGEHDPGWRTHFRSLNAYASHENRIYPLRIKNKRAYQACEVAAIQTLRSNGYLFDPDTEILSRYG